MKSKSQHMLRLIFILFCLAALLLISLFFQQTKTYAVTEGQKQIENLLLTHKAIHSYIENDQKPAIYALKEQGDLYQDYFNPNLMSFTYIAYHIKEYLNEELVKSEREPLYFKLAAHNPRNPNNTPDAHEANLLTQMNQGKIKKYTDIIEKDGLSYLYYAVPINANKQSCMRCHGDPKDAPAELITRYGDTAGFYEKLGDIRAMISIRVPLMTQLADARQMAYLLSGLTVLILGTIFLIIRYFMLRLDKQRHIIEQKNQMLEKLAQTDALTGIDNRLKFNHDIQQALEAAKRHQYPLSISIVDLDLFKNINDTFGHTVGDKVLIEVAKTLKKHTRLNDLVARWGGEEFILVYPHTDSHAALSLLERLRQEIAKLTFAESFQITASFGLTTYEREENLISLLDRADRALYRAKDQGRNQVQLITP